MEGFIVPLKCGNNLNVLKSGRSIEFIVDEFPDNHGSRRITLEPVDFKDFIKQMFYLANVVWLDIEPKEAISEASDYYEYYDKRYDNNGYLGFDYKEGWIKVCEVSEGSRVVYKFNKRKMQSFLYDLREEENIYGSL